METQELSKKSFIQSISAFIHRHTLLTSTVLCTVFFLFYLALNGFGIKCRNDDYFIFKLINFGDLGIGCVGFFYTSFIALLQPLFGALNFHSVFHEILIFSSMITFNYVFLSKLKSKTGILLACAFDLVFFSFFGLVIHFTYAASAASTAGIVLLFYALQYETRKKFRITQIVFSALLLFFGSQLRYDPALPAYALIFVLLFCEALLCFLTQIKNSGFKNSIINTIKKHS